MNSSWWRWWNADDPFPDEHNMTVRITHHHADTLQRDIPLSISNPPAEIGIEKRVVMDPLDFIQGTFDPPLLPTLIPPFWFKSELQAERTNCIMGGA